MTRPWWAGPTAAVLFQGVWPTRVHGADAVPVGGGLLLASNHLGLLDGPLMVGVAPRWVQCLVKSELFHGMAGVLLRSAGQIPVDRDRGDRAALGRALEVLTGGGTVGVFPEGTRGRGDVSGVRLGIAWLALRSGAPVVPVACLGTRRTGESTRGLPALRRPLDVVFGTPIALGSGSSSGSGTGSDPGVPGRVALAAAGATLQEAIAAHVRYAVTLTGQQLPADLGWSDDENVRGEHL